MKADSVFSRILVPTDFSSGSERAWRLAQQMATAMNAELVLLHVLPGTPVDLEVRLQEEERKAELRARQATHQLGIPRGDEESPRAGRVFDGPLTGTAVSQFSEAGRRWAEKLEEWAAQARADGLKVHSLFRVGVPYHEVVATAKEEQVDLVLLATHGRGEIQRLLVGSVADRVIRMAPCPVLTVKDH